jgi:hypothetical protein
MKLPNYTAYYQKLVSIINDNYLKHPLLRDIYPSLNYLAKLLEKYYDTNNKNE